MSDLNQDELNKVVGELRLLAETKSKESAEYKEKVDKISIDFENAEKRNTELVTKISEQKAAEKALADKIEQMETKFYRPTGKNDVIVKSEAEQNFDRALLSLDRIDTNRELKAMSYASKQECTEKKYLRTDSNIDGGYLCPPQWAVDIAKKKIEFSPMRSICRVIAVSSKLYEQPIRNTLSESYFEGEAEDTTSSNSQYGLLEVANHRHTAKIPITYEMLNDGHYDIAAEIQSDVAIQFAKKEGYMFIRGNGVKEPTGIMHDPENLIPTRHTGIANDVDFDTLKRTTGDLKVGYTNPIFILNRRTIAELSTKKDSVGAYLWQEGSTKDGVPSTLVGYPYVRAIDMDDIGANKYPLLFGSFIEGYLIVDRFGMYVIRDDFTQAGRAMIQYIFHTYTGGHVRFTEAFIKIQCHV